MRLVTLIIIITTLGCRQPNPTLFELLPPGKTGIDFSNTIQENEVFNILTYEYLYNGAGVAIGDINNDGLPDIYFTGNMVYNKLYLNKGDLQFEDITEKAGVRGRDLWKTGVSMADVNGDGWMDIYVCYSGPGSNEARRNELYINNGLKGGVPTFIEKAVEYGLDAPGTFTTQVAFFDMDRDNDLDMFMVNHADMFYNPFFNTNKLRNLHHPKFGNRLYRNDDGKFTDISKSAGIHGSGLNFGLGISVSDINSDGWPDLYVSNDYNEQDFLYLNNHGGGFKEVIKRSMGHIAEFSMGVDIADYNNDLRPDIVSMDMLPEDNKRQKLLKGADGYDKYQLLVDSGFHHQYMRNMLQLNMGLLEDSVPVFSEIAQLAGVSNTDWSWAPLMIDFDNDGWKDLYITNGYLRDFTNLDFIKFTYADADRRAQIEKKKLNTWELIKQLPSTRISNYIFCNNRNLTFSNKSIEWGIGEHSISTGASYADLDNDGDIDLVVNNNNDKAMIFENHSNALSQNHFARVKLIGKAPNTFGIGSKVIVTTDSSRQLKEQYTTRGFQSSVDPVLHFGLGNITTVKSIQVIWPDGTNTILKNVRADSLYTITQSHEHNTTAVIQSKEEPLFVDYTDESGLNYKHEEGNHVDFKKQFLLPHQVSKQGPFIAKGDVNGDGLEDLYIGGTPNKSGQLFLQKKGGVFTVSASQPWVQDRSAKDAGVLFFDADADQDLDLLIVKGGGEFSPNGPFVQDVLYTNNGKGVFAKATNAIPKLNANGSCITIADYDKDGDIDVFIGGYAVPGNYPIASGSYLLRNETKNGVVKFEIATDQNEKKLWQPGLVKSAVWADLNNDTWPDLVVTGEFMPVMIFENRQGKLIDATKKFSLNNTGGLWCKITAADMDNDGDIDLIAGNVGLNTQWRTSVDQPLSVCYSDFDNNGTIDPIFCYYIQGKNYPAATLDEIAEQLPGIRKRFLRYEAYSQASFNDMFSLDQKQKPVTLNVAMLASTYFENSGNGRFTIHTLPLESQFSVVSGIVVQDIDHDGKKDMLLSGNYYPWRVQWGRMDASMGLLCKGDGKGNYSPLQYAETGLLLQGDIRDMVIVQTSDNKSLIIVSKNNDNVQVMKIREVKSKKK